MRWSHPSWSWLVLVLLGAILLLPGLGQVTMTRQQELRVALTARAMAEGGSWLFPEFRGEPRLRKPPFMYWAVAVAYRLSRSTFSPYVARLPTALSGLVLLGAIASGGAWLVGRRRAWLAGFSLLGGYLFLKSASQAEADVPITLCMVLATFFLYAALSRDRAWCSWIAFGIASGLGFMVKGPAAIVMPLLAGTMFLVWDTRARKHFKSVHLVAGLAAFTIVALPWYLAVLCFGSAHGAAHAAVESELGRLLLQSAHPGSVFYYTYNLPLAMLPFGILLPFALWSAFRRARRHRGMRFLLGWWGSSFLLLSVLSSKQIHYAVLLLPPSCLLVGWYLPRLLRRGSVFVSAERLAVAVAVLCLFGFNLYAFLLHDRLRPESVIKDFAQASRPLLHEGQQLYGVGRHAASMEFYLGRELVEADSVKDAWRRGGPGDAIAVLSRPDRPTDLAETKTTPEVDMARADVRCALIIRK